MDIDIDLSPERRPEIFKRIREERGELGIAQVCTFGTMTAKSAIQNACRGLGINNDEALYLSSLVPIERGFTWSIKDMVYGNAEKGRKPVKTFVSYVKQFPNLLDTILAIEGCVSRRGTHASGVLFFNAGSEYEHGAFMRSPDGTLVTQWDLHDAEYCGATKYDFLVTEIETKIQQCIHLLQEDNVIDPNLSLREAYDKYLHPDALPVDEDKIWDAIDEVQVKSLFQFDSLVGKQTVKALKPRDLHELTAANALMRLMGEPGAERPSDKYVRYKSNLQLWYTEMNQAGLSPEEQKVFEEHFLNDYGVPYSQEQLMLALMDERLCGFSLAEANQARKIVAKKKMDEIPKFKEKVLSRAVNPQVGNFLWHTVVTPQLGYSFSSIHGLAYSAIAVQCAVLATHFDSIYWDCACLRVDAGIDEESATNYNKIAKGVGATINQGVSVSLVDINKSAYLFRPDVQNHTILYCLKAINGVSGETANQIMENRPYVSFEDFIEKNNFNKTVMVNLIKAGAFDKFEERKDVMEKYLREQSNPKKRITMQNFNALSQAGLLPKELNFQERLYVFSKALKKNKSHGDYFIIEKNYYKFFCTFFDVDDLTPIESGQLAILKTKWKQLYDKKMLAAKTYITQNKESLLSALNNSLFKEIWDKYAEGNYSKWEMDSLGFYYSGHELAGIREKKYDIVHYKDLPENPEVDYTFKRKGREIPIFKTFRICGTVIAKEDSKSIVSILTKESGVVNVKFSRDYYARLNKQISEIGKDGHKHVMEKGFFTKGTWLVVNGMRRGDTFVAKRYSRTPSHQCYKITDIHSNGDIEMTHLRWGEEEE